MFDESKHPRDANGKFTAKGGAPATPYKDLLEANGYDTADMSEEWAEYFAKELGITKMVRIPLNFFGEKGLESQGINQLKKGISTKQKKIAFHRWKIENPQEVYSDWDSFDEERKQRALRHWEQEIETHLKEIAEREKLIRQKEKKK